MGYAGVRVLCEMKTLGACGQAEYVDLLDSGTVEQTHLKFTQNSQTDLDRHILIEGGISASSFKM